MTLQAPLFSMGIDIASSGKADAVVDVALATMRTHLGMEVAYMSEFVDNRAVFRAVSAPGLEDVLPVGGSQQLSDIYCQHILEGRLPNLIPDTCDEEIARNLPITAQAQIGSHVSVPIHREDGSVCGMFCCLSPRPNPTLNERDLQVMITFADLGKGQIQRDLRARDALSDIQASIDAVIGERQLEIFYNLFSPPMVARPKGLRR